MSREAFYGEQYLAKSVDWHLSDSPWKASIVMDIYRKNGLQPNTIIDTGCGAGLVLEELLRLDNHITAAVGYDISPVAIELAKARKNDRLAFVEGNIPPHASADLLVMMDVVEHVEDYYGFLRRLIAHGEYFVFHIPLDLCCRTVLKPFVLSRHRESVGHLHYWTEEMVWWMLDDCGYEVVDYQFTKPVIDTERPDGWKRRIKKNLRNLSYTINPSLSSKLWGGYSLLILAKARLL